MPDDLQEAKRLAKAGRKAEARQIASRMVRKEKDNVAAWVVLAQVVDTREQAIDCLKQVLRLEPGHPWAMMHLNRLTEQAARPAAPPPPPQPEPEPEPAWEGLDTPTPAPDAMSDLLGDIPAPATRSAEADLDPLSGTTPWRRPPTSMDADTFDELRAGAAKPPRRRARWLPLVLLFVIFVLVGAGLICAMQMGLLGGAPQPNGMPTPTGAPTTPPTGEAPTAESTEPPATQQPTEEPTAQPTTEPTEAPTATVEATGGVPLPIPPGTGDIVFARQVGDSGELFLVNRDGSGVTQITSGAFVNPFSGMDWSPDGAHIAFVAEADEDGDGIPAGDIFIANADGSGLANLTQSAAEDMDPQWSPDGQYIAFTSDAEGPHIAIAPASPPSLPATVTYGPAGGSPSWSPDSASIAFSTTTAGSGDIFVLDVACTLGELACEINPTQLTTDGAANERPEWSPDGTRIAYVSGRDGGPDLWAMNIDGSSPTRLSTNGFHIATLAWSPDGTRIAYDASSTEVDIYMANADGSGAAPLVAAPSADFSPVWSPDGTQIVFESHPDIASPGDIYIVNADGAGLAPLSVD